MKVSIVGQGYVGLPLALAAASSGFEVLGIDSNSIRVENLNRGISTIEDVGSETLSEIIAKGKYKATTDYSKIRDSKIVVICVPTPLNEKGNPDLSYLESASSSISENLAPETLVILESTVSPGTTREFVANILSKSKNKFLLAYSPERIDPANKIWTVKNTPKLVAGIDSNSTEAALNFYKTFIDTVISQDSIEVIETAKLLENTFRLINISFINEIAKFCHNMNIDVREVIQAASTKPYGFMPFYPSIGVGGHCIPVDPAYLTHKANEINSPIHIAELATDINRKNPKFFVQIAKEKLGNLENKKILVIGIAYKPNVADIRESAAIDLIKELRNIGADVSWHDNLVSNWNHEKTTPLSNDFDLIILANIHSTIDISNLDSTKILDTRGGY